MKKIIILIVGIFVFVNSAIASTVPFKVQSAFLFKIFGSDKGLLNLVDENVKIGIVYNSTSEASKLDQEGILIEFTSAAKINKLVGKSVSSDIVLVDVNSDDWLDKLSGLSIAYVTSGLGSVVKEVGAKCTRDAIRTFCVDKNYLDRGICSAVIFEDGKPKIYINKNVAKLTGVQFNAMVLRYATII